MPAIGYSEGYLEALSTLSGVAAQQQGIAASRQQMQMRQKEQQDNAQEKSILAEVFKSRAGDQQVMDQLTVSDRLAQQYREAGRKLMGTSPAEAMRMLQEGDRLQHNTALERLEAAKTEKVKGEYLGGLAATVGSQEELNEFVRRSAKGGRTIDRKYQVWNEATKEYLQRFAQGTMMYSKQQELAIKTRAEELKAQDEERKKKKDETDAKDKDRKNVLAQERIDVRKRAAASKSSRIFDFEPGSKKAEAEKKIFIDTDKSGEFRKLPEGVQLNVMKDARDIAKKTFEEQFAELDPEDRDSPDEIAAAARKQAIKKWQATQKGPLAAIGLGEKDAERVERGGVDQKTSKPGNLPATRTVIGVAYYLHADGKYYPTKEE